MPVIVLTARDSVGDTVSALEGGADDYMPKPFRFAELLARVRLRLRQGTTPPAPRQERVEAGGVSLDLRTRRAQVGEREVDLSAREFALAEIFMVNAGQVLSREQLLDHVWGLDFDPGSNVVDVYVGYLRRKFGADTIATVRGMGYRFSPLAGPQPATEPDRRLPVEHRLQRLGDLVRQRPVGGVELERGVQRSWRPRPESRVRQAAPGRRTVAGLERPAPRRSRRRAVAPSPQTSLAGPVAAVALGVACSGDM